MQAVEACIDDAGEIDPECLFQVDEAYLVCLEECGVDLPEPPDIPEDDCFFRCDQEAQAAFEACFDPQTGEIDDACLAAVDAAFVECLEACGVDFPGNPDIPQPPGEACVDECGEQFLQGVMNCFDNGGELDIGCLEKLATDFHTCLESCDTPEEKRATVAMVRSVKPPFLRGDANRDSALDVSDAVVVLSYLFRGVGDLNCMDAADANDDSVVDISDPLFLLNSLFLGAGSLPEPSGDPGQDPTGDDLSCEA